MTKTQVLFSSNSEKGLKKLQTKNEDRKGMSHGFFMLLTLTLKKPQNQIDSFSLYSINNNSILFQTDF